MTDQALNVIWKPQPGSQELAVSCPCHHILYEGTRGPGKSLSNDELVFTDSGWKKAGEVSYSDRLLAPDGTYTEITGIYPQGDLDIFRVIFDEGSSVLCCSNHRWLINDGKNKGWKVRETGWLSPRVSERKKQGRRERFQTPRISSPAPGKPWRGLDPYVAGLLMGDGTYNKNGKVLLYSADQETIDLMKHTHGWGGNKYDGQSCYMLWPKIDEMRKWKMLLGEHKREDKRIPQSLLDSDADTRLSVLQGLLDSDGTIDNQGKVQFINTSEHLCKGVQYIVRSLGGKATYSWHDREGGIEHKNGLGGRYRVYINLPKEIVPFRLTRKVDRVKPKVKSLNRGIVSIEPAGRGGCVCFSVDHSSKQFVINNFVVTHNTDVQLMFYRRFVGIGYGERLRGIIFDREYKNLDDLISKSKRWFSKFGDGARFLSGQTSMKWVWPTGEELLFRALKTEGDYWKFHGMEFPFIGFNELTKYPNSDLYEMVGSLNRSSFLPEEHPIIDHKTGEQVFLPPIPLTFFSTTNPYGPGHNWVKQRFIDSAPPGVPIRIVTEVFNPQTQKREKITKTQVRIFGSYKENRYLSPEYVAEIESIRDPNKRAAWLYGDWNITSGGMFDDVFSTDHNIVEPFDIPHTWRIFRSFDWGSSKPFSVGWWAESDGSDYRDGSGSWRSSFKGDLFRIGEWYGWSGSPNKGIRLIATKITKGIVEREIKLGIRDRVKPGPADNSINDVTNGSSIAGDMRKPVLINGRRHNGVEFSASDKSPGSRKNGWEKMRIAIYNAQPTEFGAREAPGLFVFRTCQDGFIRTVPSIPRDSKDQDDIDTDAEDHVCDETRYVILSAGDRFSSGRTTGHF